MKKRVLKVILIIIILLIAIVAAGSFYLSRGLNEGVKLQVSSIDVSSKKDGTYEGTYNGGRWTNTVAVTVKGGKITDIKILKDVTFAKSDVTSSVIKDVLKAQNTTVDAVTGATVTSKAYLKAIENAISKK